MGKTLRFLMLLAVLCTGWSMQEARASHAAGGELIYKWVSDSTWRFTMKFYRDCAGISEPDSMQLCYFDTCNPANPVKSVWMHKSASLPSTGNEVSPGCPNFPTTCNGGTLPGYIEFWYEADVTLPYRCNKWVFTVTESSRNSSISNINIGNLHIRAELNNTLLPYNNSVYFTNKPVPYVCVGAPFSFNNGALDIDGDKMVFASIQPLDGSCNARTPTSLAYRPANFTYGTPNVSTNPFNTNNTFNVDPQNGTVTFIPYVSEIAAITIKVDEFRGSQWIGSVMRDIQIIVRPCNFAPPSTAIDTTSNVNLLPNGYVLTCPNGALQFCFNIKTADTGALLKFSNNLPLSIPTASINVTSTGQNSAYICFNWTPGTNDTGVHTFTVTATDTSCRPPGIQLSQTFAYSIYVAPPTEILSDTIICEGDTARLTAINGTQFTWSAVPGGDGMNHITFPDSKKAKALAFPRKTTQYIAKSNLDPKCKITDTVTVKVITKYGSGEILAFPNDTAICEPGYVNLRSAIFSKPQPPATVHQYVWEPGLFVNDSTQANTFGYVENTTVFTITAWDSLGCEIKDTIHVNVSKRDFGVSPLDTTICIGDQYDLKTKGGVKWVWSGNAAHTTLSCYTCPNPVALPLNNGTYQVIISDKYNCADTFTTNVTLMPLPHIVATPHDTLVNFGTPVTLKATGGVSYNWTPVSGISNPNAPMPVVTPTQPTTYIVVGRGQNGCAATDTARINLDMRDKLYVPTAFSPNKDGANDRFKVVNLTFQKVIEFRIFDRWGHEVFNGVGSGNAITGWDGMIDGKEAPLGVYNYMIRIAYPDGYADMLKGNLTLVR